MFWSLYLSSTLYSLSFVTYPAGAESSLTIYLPSGSSFDVAFPFSSVVMISTSCDIGLLLVLYTLESSITPIPFPDAAVAQ